MNVLYIHTHDTGRQISPYGFDVPTHNMFNFAKDATTFTQAFCVNPTCSPSRAGLLTGVYPHQNGMLGLAQRGFALDDYEKHLCRYLKKFGYTSVLSGIQHEVDYYLNVGASDALGYDEILTTSSKEYAAVDLHHWDEKNALEAVKWIESYNGEKPFFLSYGMHSTHRPFPIEIDPSINEQFVKPCAPIYNNAENRHDYAQYLTSAKHADECFELVINALKEKGLYDNTIIIFTTDHGLAYPYNKCTLSDRGIGVSLIVRDPRSEKQGVVCDTLISHIDVFPTLCDMLNIDKPEYLEGKSLAGVFKGEEVENEYVFAEVNFHTSYEPIRCVRTKRYKLVKYMDETHLKTNPSNTDSSVPKDFYVENGYIDMNKDGEALYDLYYDPQEKNNIIDQAELQEVVAELRAKLSEFQHKTSDPLLVGPLEIKSTYKVNKKSCLNASSKNPEDYEEAGKFY